MSHKRTRKIVSSVHGGCGNTHAGIFTSRCLPTSSTSNRLGYDTSPTRPYLTQTMGKWSYLLGAAILHQYPVCQAVFELVAQLVLVLPVPAVAVAVVALVASAAALSN